MKLVKTIIGPWYRAKARLHRRSYVLGALMHVGTVVAVAFAAIFIFTFYILQPYEVSGMSMHPTLHDGDRLFILRTGKIFANLFGTDYVPERGEIIVFESRVNDDKWIKRIVGLPGERIVIKNNRITVYNREFPQGFEPKMDFDPPLADFPPDEKVVDRLVGQGEAFVIGDNRLKDQSSDSRRELGNISLEDIDGTVLIRVVPLADFRFF